MSHEHFALRAASPEGLTLLVSFGAASLVLMLALVGFLLWRDRRSGAGKSESRPARRARKVKRRP